MEFIQFVITLLGLRLSRSDDASGDLVGYLLVACSVLLWCYVLFLAIEDLVLASRRVGKLHIARLFFLILWFVGIGIGVAAYLLLPKDFVGDFWGLTIQLFQIIFPLSVCLTYLGWTLALFSSIGRRVRDLFCPPPPPPELPVTITTGETPPPSTAFLISTITSASLEMASALSKAFSTAVAAAVPTGSLASDGDSSTCSYDGHYTVTTAHTISTAAPLGVPSYTPLLMPESEIVHPDSTSAPASASTSASASASASSSSTSAPASTST